MVVFCLAIAVGAIAAASTGATGLVVACVAWFIGYACGAWEERHS